jgi:hypothetical protein
LDYYRYHFPFFLIYVCADDLQWTCLGMLYG